MGQRDDLWLYNYDGVISAVGQWSEDALVCVGVNQRWTHIQGIAYFNDTCIHACQCSYNNYTLLGVCELLDVPPLHGYSMPADENNSEQ